MAKTDLTAQRLRELLHYDPETGVFTRIATGKGTGPLGSIAGSMTQHGYLKIGVSGPQRYCHRLAWLYMTGEWPRNQIDHINGDRSNNAFYNLRDVYPVTNMQNKRAAQSNNKTGLLGVSFNKKKNRWIAQIKTTNGKSRYIGSFTTQELAYAAYLKAKRESHEGNTL